MASGAVVASSEAIVERGKARDQDGRIQRKQSERAPAHQESLARQSGTVTTYFSNPENQKTPDHSEVFLNWCPEEDSNLHEVAPAST